VYSRKHCVGMCGMLILKLNRRKWLAARNAAESWFRLKQMVQSFLTICRDWHDEFEEIMKLAFFLLMLRYIAEILLSLLRNIMKTF
jgi:hypothetical protein